MISNKKATFQILDEYDNGDKFTGFILKMLVKSKTGKELFPATSLRYMREYRELTGRQIVNVHKMRSLYRVVG